MDSTKQLLYEYNCTNLQKLKVMYEELINSHKELGPLDDQDMQPLIEGLQKLQCERQNY